MFGFRTALGIDISDGQINLALVKKNGDGIKLLKAASGPVPDGAIKNGNVEDVTALTKAIKKLKSRNRIRAHHTALSLVANPTLMQILDLPKDAPANVRQFVHNEVKHYAVLPIKKAAIDFCGIKSSGKSGHRRAFVVATDGQKVAAVAKALNKEGLNIEAIEPAWISYIRACYAEKIAKKFDTNHLFALAYDDTVTLCLFRNQILDFVRTKPIEPDTFGSEEYFDWLAEEIDAVVKFYELEVPEKRSKWQVTLITSIDAGSVSEKAGSLRAKLNQVELEVRTLEHVHLTISVGLATKLLNVPSCGLNINLLPREVAEDRSAEKQTLVITNIAAVAFLLLILSIGFFNTKANKIDVNKEQEKRAQLTQETQTLLTERASLQGQVEDISGRLELMNDALSTGPVLEWGRILNDIMLVIPKTMRITELSSDDNSQILLQGQTLSYEAIHLFVEALNTCKNVGSASLIGTQKDSESEELVGYSISCSCSLTQ